ncbi:histidine kinase [Bacillus sp. FJAT-18017]|uniref:sensor histidine kinase n=1 Tax=Bacillus sp. FJAT-18017 TaxID=1705566 RepID=UPI0006ADA5CB|nr:sensor histidine kinase [Bacillus sp. FJAT-18017]ALC91070.1 histidine kinase [Bacillus sp. FJAT-18017]
MAELLPLMLERVGILIIVTFLLSRMRSFREVIHNEHGLKEKMMLILIFGLFGIISNYTGIEIDHGEITSQVWQVGVEDDGAIANTRIMGVAIGGLLGGPLVGFGAGLVSGLHRLTLGGFTAEACAISTLIAGVVAGLIGRRFDVKGKNSDMKAVIIGLLMEGAQMGIILLLARPFAEAYQLVSLIAIPMISINAFGTLLFMLMIQAMVQEEERTRVLETHKALYIAQQTLPFFRQGLSTESATDAATIILKWTNADAIAITNQDEVLAHVGEGGDHHIAGQKMVTLLTKKVICEGEILKAKSTEEIQCNHKGCPLHAAIVLPLKANGTTIGTLKLYYKNPKRLDLAESELAEGLSKLFSTQLELGDAELQRRLLKDAEIKALQAQVHPHFLFNSMNTISSLIRTDAEKARKLLLKLSTFFRSNLQGANHMLIPLKKELEHLEAYMSLEQARFPDKYKVEIDVSPDLQESLIPPFILQPLVENSIRHAFQRKSVGRVTVTAFSEEGKMYIVTQDNGNGIRAAKLQILGADTVESEEGSGTALWNIKKRIKELYGHSGSFKIESDEGIGTTVTIALPLSYSKKEGENLESIYS